MMEVVCIAEFGGRDQLPLRLRLPASWGAHKTCGDVLEVLRAQAESRRPGGFPATLALTDPN